MYCTLLYSEVQIPIHEKEITPQNSAESIPASQTTNSTIIPDSKKLLVNPNCYIQILLEYICGELGIDKLSNFDLCDFDTGQFMDTKQLKPWDSALEVLQPKHTYIVVFYERDDLGIYTKLEPLLSQPSKQYSEIMLKIKRQLGSTIRKNSSIIKKKRGSYSSRASTGSQDSQVAFGSNKTRSKMSTKNRKPLM